MVPPEAGSVEGQSEVDSSEVGIAEADISLPSVSRAEVGTSSAISTENQHVCLKPGFHTMHPSACPRSDALPCTACCAFRCGCKAAYLSASDTSR